MQGKRGIIIAGMHGKTTTSAMTAHVLREGGLHPSHYVGAEIPILGQNAHWDPRGEYFVAEGDESDGTIRCFHPEHIADSEYRAGTSRFLRRPGGNRRGLSSVDRQTTGKVFYCADDAVATRRLSVATARFPTALAKVPIIARRMFRAAGFRLGLFCFPAGSKTGRSATECSGPAQCAERARRHRAGHRARHSVRENRQSLCANFSTRAAVSRSNMPATVFCWSTITRIIRPKFAPRSRPRVRPGANAC